MKNSLLAVILFIGVSAKAQYYYNDIQGTKEISARMNTYRAANVRSVTAVGFDPQGTETRDFNEWQDVQGDILKVTTRNGQVASRTYYTFDANNRLINARDSSSQIQSSTEYRYDSQDRLTAVLTTTRDVGEDFNETEERQWKYSAASKPERMLRIVNGKDSSEFIFELDEHGNVAEERPARRMIGVDPVYYYYDDKSRITDIVRYDKHVKQLLPDVMFEYDDKDHIIQRRTTLSTRPPDYLIWRYLFNEKGLKTKEALFSKTRELKGRIEYRYEFLP
jgi:YD repeat-containing protein